MLYIEITFFLYTHILMSIKLFPYLDYCNNAVINLGAQICLQDLHFISLYIYPEVKLLR